jgi:hypothetical protein
MFHYGFAVVVAMHNNLDLHLSSTGYLDAPKVPWIWSADSHCGDIPPKNAYNDLLPSSFTNLKVHEKRTRAGFFVLRLGGTSRADKRRTGVPFLLYRYRRFTVHV